MTLDSIVELRMSVWSINDAEYAELVSEVQKKGWDLSLTRKIAQINQLP
jgi:hypothetical protein